MSGVWVLVGTRKGAFHPAYYEECGSGKPLLLLAPGGLNSTVDFLSRMPLNPIEAFSSGRACGSSHQRARSLQPGGPVARGRAEVHALRAERVLDPQVVGSGLNEPAADG